MRGKDEHRGRRGLGREDRHPASASSALKSFAMIAADRTVIKPGKLLIAGEWVETAKSFDTFNPATGEVLTHVAEASAVDVDRAIAAARAAFEKSGKGAWRSMSASERGRLLWKVADLVEKNIEELAELETLDNGKPIFESRYVDMPMVI